MKALDIEQMAPLRKTAPMGKTTQSGSTHSSTFYRNYKWLVPLILGLFAMGSFFFLSENEAELLPEDITAVKPTTSDGGSGGSGSGIVSSSSTGDKKENPDPFADSTSTGEGKNPNPFAKFFGTPSPTSEPNPPPSNSPTVAPTTEPQNPLLNLPRMLLAFQEKRTKWFHQLEQDYGKENFQKMLLDHGRSAIRPPNETATTYSNDRMRRKMMIKILEAQEAATRRHRNLRSHSNGFFQGNNSTDTDNTAESSAQRTRRQAGSTNPHEFPKYIWATGGHSATAGHGNMWRESYTAVLERGVRDVFAACGIDFVGRNYAMGGTSSGPEIAMCGKEIYGTDIDVLVWDTGMVDGGEHYRMLMYMLRAGILANQPAAVALHLGRDAGRMRAMQAVEDTGMPTFVMVESEDKAINDAIPDTFGKSDAEIAEMPEFVRNFRCGKQVENGDPGCNDLKFNKTMCNGRKFRVSWHPGWRWHAMVGNLLGVWITNIMEDALKELAQNEPPRPSLLNQLRALEVADRQSFMSHELPTKILEDLPIPDDVDRDIFYRGANFCHTARLPAETRHQGILTESVLVGEDSYDKGTEMRDAIQSLPDDSSMQLVYEQNDRQICPIPLNKDYKDFFYVRGTHGWSQLTLPNNAELQAYGTGEALRGVVAVCFSTCDWGHCPTGNLVRDDIVDGKAEIRVNGIRVTNLTKFDNDCNFLKNNDGHVWKPNSDGLFQLRVKVNEERSFVRFSSIVVW